MQRTEYLACEDCQTIAELRARIDMFRKSNIEWKKILVSHKLACIIRIAFREPQHFYRVDELSEGLDFDGHNLFFWTWEQASDLKIIADGYGIYTIYRRIKHDSNC